MGSGGPRGLKKPCFVKCSMVACFENVYCGIEVLDVLVCCCIPKKDASIVVVVQFAASQTWRLDAHPRTKGLEVGYVRLLSVPYFVGCYLSGGVDKSL